MHKILIADDSEETRAAIRGALTSHGWTICGEASDGSQAVCLAGQLAPDLIVVDLSMPAMTGLEAAKEILRTAPAVPIILYTLHKAAQLDAAAARVGVRKVLSKADGIAPLIAGIEELLGQLASPLDPVGPLAVPVESKAKPLPVGSETAATPISAAAEVVGPLAVPTDHSLRPLALPSEESPAAAEASSQPVSPAGPPEPEA
jgi:CheY-like chemotaxis protein